MAYLRFSLVAMNALLFVGLAVLSLTYRRREDSPRTKRLWAIVAIISGAFVFGSVQRLIVQASILGWVSRSFSDSAQIDWQLIQSLIVGVMAIAAFLGIRNVAASLSTSERVAGSILDRVSHIAVDDLSLSPRETEVLHVIGTGLVTDAELSTALHISASTVQSHVKSLLRKTGLGSRKDLIAVAHMIEKTH